MSVWDDPDLQNGGEFVEFNNIGDGVSGIINVVRTHTFDDGKKVPQILMVTDEGEEKTLTAGQVRLKAELVEQRPEPGDHLAVHLSQVEKRAGGKTLKHFTVTVTRGGGVPAAAPAEAPAATPATPAAPVTTPAAVDPAAAAAALAALSPEQRAALGLG